ncbi:hypothetical protein FA09DRAFT_314530 [Tilletiopsis washingtonensis]|uniref:Lipid droplet-associated perilipin protein n=1 Tax=Tilletiopsis washingtonensis TaxID=58919 RepID=A0A316ZIG4_9BASI|nr:hypothetical protein FA09DRAFT_314530 [Tilletiopsis washingtonensis]PWO00815.1 hypothetical protein FA09DRAFT_314530 [Tilletiopsis washingtonensis]
MSAATAPAPQSAAPAQYGEAVKRISTIPLVNETVSYAHSTVSAHPLLARGYQLGEQVFTQSVEAAKPIAHHLQPQLALADAWAVKGLELAERTVPYPFHATTSDVYSAARAPADQALSFLQAYASALQKAYDERVSAPAKSLYEARVAPAYDSATQQFEQLKSQNAYLQRATEIVGNLQNNLAKNLDAVSGRGKAEGDAAAQKAQGLSNAIFAELDRVRNFALSLPAESRKRVDPVLSTFTDAYEHLSKEARDTSVPVTTRLSKVVEFVRTQSIPALQKAVVHPDAAQASQPLPNGVAK